MNDLTIVQDKRWTVLDLSKDDILLYYRAKLGVSSKGFKRVKEKIESMSNSDMEKLARKIEDDVKENSFWPTVEYIIGDMS
jgi:hypothetical protein